MICLKITKTLENCQKTLPVALIWKKNVKFANQVLKNLPLRNKIIITWMSLSIFVEPCDGSLHVQDIFWTSYVRSITSCLQGVLPWKWWQVKILDSHLHVGLIKCLEITVFNVLLSLNYTVFDVILVREKRIIMKNTNSERTGSHIYIIYIYIYISRYWVKSVQVRSFSGSYFLTFGLNRVI